MFPPSPGRHRSPPPLLQASRLLLTLTALLLLVMPFTESLCTWDHFLRGGPDVELSLLALLAFLGLVLVLSRRGSRALAFLLTLGRNLVFHFRAYRPVLARLRGLLFAVSPPGLPQPPLLLSFRV